SAQVPSGTANNQLSIGNLIFGTSLDGINTQISTGKIGIGVKAPSERLQVDGNVLATSHTTPSDAALKHSVEPVSGALETVGALRPVTYAWKDTVRFGERREYGLIAQEVEPVLPSVVHGGQGREYSLNYAKLVPVLIGAVQEQQAQIAALTARLAALESEV
ncbi:MAG: tail fiber domain-containing protein, partial [Chloroflexota bacterium]